MIDAQKERILVIKLSALGDVIQALGPMQAIRRHHQNAHITVLTTKPFVALLEKSGLFDAVWVDEKPLWFQIGKWIELFKKLNSGRFTRVYDLQNNDRTFFYLRLFHPRPEWVGAAPGASHRNADPNRSAGHAFYGHVQTLQKGGIENVTPDDLGWMQADLSTLLLPPSYAVLVVGSAPQHLGKRWPHFAQLAQELLQKNVAPVLIGTKAEEGDIQAIVQDVPGAISLVGKTQLFDLPALARGAKAVIGNDTGPMHIMAPTGARTIVVMGPLSNPKRHYPLGANVTILHKDVLAEIETDQVMQALASVL